jgi:hypothetical protein
MEGGMTERQMEDLIAEFPDDFFRGHGFVLKGRQQSFAEVGRFDLLFVDSFQTNILMELKARPAKYEDASQLAKYKDALQQRSTQRILMWLVAPQIPNSVREFLDQIGIEYSEIHPAQYLMVAQRHGIKLDRQESSGLDTPAGVGKNPARSSDGSQRRTVPRLENPYTLNASFDRAQLDQLLRSFDSVVRRRIDRSVSQRLRRELLDTNPASISRSTMGQLAKWCKTENPLYWDGMDVARKISQLLFGCILDRTKLGV